ncbi:hypothetical protein EK904_002262 [Melospiza melodia maxima]|nr:hypothetical protein EK904_002262 [Melospiza melodia maxima]
MSLARQKLQRHLEAVSARQQLALRRNQALRREFLQLEAHMETTGWENIWKMGYSLGCCKVMIPDF